MSNFLNAFIKGSDDSGLTTSVGSLEAASGEIVSALALSDAGAQLEYDDTAAKIFNIAKDVLANEDSVTTTNQKVLDVETALSTERAKIDSTKIYAQTMSSTFNTIVGALNDVIDTTNDNVALIEGGLMTTNTAANALKSRVTTAEGGLTTTNNAANALTSRVTTAEGGLTTTNNAANALNSRVTTAEGGLTTTNTAANALTSRVTTAEGGLTTTNNAANTLKSRVTTVEGGLTTTNNAANTLKSRVTTVEGGLTTTNNAANTLTNRVNTAEGVLANLPTDYTSTATFQTEYDRSSGLRNRVQRQDEEAIALRSEYDITTTEVAGINTEVAGINTEVDSIREYANYNAQSPELQLDTGSFTNGSMLKWSHSQRVGYYLQSVEFFARDRRADIVYPIAQERNSGLQARWDVSGKGVQPDTNGFAEKYFVEIYHAGPGIFILNTDGSDVNLLDSTRRQYFSIFARGTFCRRVYANAGAGTLTVEANPNEFIP